MEFFRPRSLAYYSNSSYDFDYYNKLGELYTSEKKYPTTRLFSNVKVSPPKETISKEKRTEVYSNSLYSITNTYYKKNEKLDFDEDPPSGIKEVWSLSDYKVQPQWMPPNYREWLDDFDLVITEGETQVRTVWSISTYLHNSINPNIALQALLGDEIVIPPSAPVRTFFSNSNYILNSIAYLNNPKVANFPSESVHT